MGFLSRLTTIFGLILLSHACVPPPTYPSIRPPSILKLQNTILIKIYTTEATPLMNILSSSATPATQPPLPLYHKTLSSKL